MAFPIRLTPKNFPDRARAVHGDKYDYANTVYTTWTAKVSYQCPLHGVQHQTAKDHLAGKGCRVCGSLSSAIARKERHAREQRAMRRTCALLELDPGHPDVLSFFQSYYTYDPDSGALRFSMTTAHRKAGDIAGNPAANGYTLLTLGRTPLREHRVIWLLHTGRWPDEIDHVNGDRSDNRIANLRDVDRQTNNENRRAPAAGKKSRLPLGVFRNHRWGNLIATLVVNRKSRHIGTFPDTPEGAAQAHEAYIVAKRLLHEGNTI